MQSLRVLQVMSSISDVNGGSTTAIWSTMNALRLRNVEVDLITTNENGLHALRDVPFGSFECERGHRVRYFPAKGDRYTTSWPMARWLVRHVVDYDLVHIHGSFRFAPVAAAHAAIVRGVPYVLTLHNTLGQWGLQNRAPVRKRLSIGLVEGRMLSRAHRVHLCSQEELRDVQQIWRRPFRHIVFPLGLEFPAQRPDGAGTCPERFAPLRGRRLVLFMSRIHEIKALDKLIAAFARVLPAQPDCQLVIAGSGDQELVTGLANLARDLGIAANTHWLGFVQGEEKQALLGMAAVFVLPSHSENFGYAAIEAMLARLPVIVSENVPAGRFAVDSGAGATFDGTVEDLADRLHSLLSLSVAERQQIGKRAESSVRSGLSLDTFGQSLESLYREARQVSLTT
jgi:glycosyltransferase involved in cell wall biosynthesis